MTYDELLDFFGTQKAAGEALKHFGPNEGVSQASVSEWRSKGIPIPRQTQYEVITNGRLKADRPGARKRAA